MIASIVELCFPRWLFALIIKLWVKLISWFFVHVESVFPVFLANKFQQLKFIRFDKSLQIYSVENKSVHFFDSIINIYVPSNNEIRSFWRWSAEKALDKWKEKVKE